MIHKLVKKLKKSKQGFTLIELIVVIAILAVLAAVLVPTIGGQISNAKTNAAKSDAQAAFTAATTFQTTQLTLPTSGTGAGTPLLASKTSGTAETYTSTDGVAFSGDSNAQANFSQPISNMLASTGFSTLTGKNGFKVTSITVASDQTITSITISDNNGSATYPS